MNFVNAITTFSQGTGLWPVASKALPLTLALSLIAQANAESENFTTFKPPLASEPDIPNWALITFGCVGGALILTIPAGIFGYIVYKERCCFKPGVDFV